VEMVSQRLTVGNGSSARRIARLGGSGLRAAPSLACWHPCNKAGGREDNGPCTEFPACSYRLMECEVDDLQEFALQVFGSQPFSQAIGAQLTRSGPKNAACGRIATCRSGSSEERREAAGHMPVHRRLLVCGK